MSYRDGHPPLHQESLSIEVSNVFQQDPTLSHTVYSTQKWMDLLEFTMVSRIVIGAEATLHHLDIDNVLE